MADSVTGIPVVNTADLRVASAGANVLGEVVTQDELTITAAGTNASLGAVTNGQATAVATSGAGTNIAVQVTTTAGGAVTRATISGLGLLAGDTVTISEIDGDAMDTNTVLTITTVEVIRDRWNQRAVVAVADHPADQGDGAERAYFVNDSLNNVWRLGRAKLGTFIVNDTAGAVDGRDIVIPQ